MHHYPANYIVIIMMVLVIMMYCLSLHSPIINRSRERRFLEIWRWICNILSYQWTDVIFRVYRLLKYFYFSSCVSINEVLSISKDQPYIRNKIGSFWNSLPFFNKSFQKHHFTSILCSIPENCAMIFSPPYWILIFDGLLKNTRFWIIG